MKWNVVLALGAIVLCFCGGTSFAAESKKERLKDFKPIKNAVYEAFDNKLGPVESTREILDGAKKHLNNLGKEARKKAIKKVLNKITKALEKEHVFHENLKEKGEKYLDFSNLLRKIKADLFEYVIGEASLDVFEKDRAELIKLVADGYSVKTLKDTEKPARKALKYWMNVAKGKEKYEEKSKEWDSYVKEHKLSPADIGFLLAKLEEKSKGAKAKEGEKRRKEKMQNLEQISKFLKESK
ncbi:MAG: hypothetical protein M1549_03685 [Candidatus Dependentiae bacterium]|nr:hypothetical protein [Candidatus Dependentiae bacterium]